MPQPTVVERPQLAAQQLLSGNVGGAWEALLSPQNLTPHEHEEYLKKLGVKGTPYESLFQSLTNPLLIASLALSHIFPPAAGKGILKLSEQVGSYTSKIPFLGRWMSKERWFRGTPVPGLLDDLAAEITALKRKYGESLGEALHAYQQEAGHLPTTREDVMLGAWLDGLHKPLRGFQGKKGRITIGAGDTRTVIDAVGVLAPNLEASMGESLLKLARTERKLYDDMWEEFFGKPENRKRILQVLRKQRDSGLADTSTEALEELLKNPRKIVDYLPHRLVQSPEEFQALVAAMTASGSGKRYGQAAARKAGAWISDEFRRREFAMFPAWQQLQLLGDALDPAAVSRLEDVVKAKVLNSAKGAGVRESTIRKLKDQSYRDIAANYGKVLNPQEAALMAEAMADGPRQYSINATEVFSSYVHTAASTHVWTGRGYGEKLLKERDILRGLAESGDAYAKARLHVFEETLLPLSMGRHTFKRALKAQAWAQGMTRTIASLDNSSIKTVLGDDVVKSLQEHLQNSKGAFSLMGLQSKATSYFYLSTLGLNPASALTNLMQNILTLGPLLGWTTTTKAMGEVMQQSHKYFALRVGPRALTHEAAIAKVFPDFAKAGLVSGHVTDVIVEDALRAAHSVAILPAAGVSVTEKISRAMMSLFTGSETVNRLSAFQAGMIHAKRAGLGADDAVAFARDIVRKTQFTLSPTSGPIAAADWGPLVKQFTYFPSKLLEFATSTAFTAGSGAIDPRTGKQMTIGNLFPKFSKLFPFAEGYNPGTAARMVAGSIISMELGDAMGLDLRGGLLGSALPGFSPVKEGSPFGALPVVPPGINVAGAFAYGLGTGEWDAMKHALPLLAPGGIVVARTAGFVPPGLGGEVGPAIAQALDRTYADYKQPAPDGRVAVYSGKGTFRGFYTPWDLLKAGLGVRGGDLDKEQELLAMVTKNRDDITQAKRDYLDARFRNSAREANAVAAQFKQKFGFSLPVSEQDMEAMQARRHVTRLEQLIRTTPAGPAREQLMQAVQATLGQSAESMLGVDPTLFGAPRPVAEKSRFGTGKVSGSSLPRFQAQADLSPMDTVNPRTIGRQPGVNQLQPLP